MNVPIIRLFGLVVVLFAVLVGFTARWTVFDGGALRANPKNHRLQLEEVRIKRGRIYAADGTLLAYSTKRKDGTYARHYPQHSLFAHVVGYDYPDIGRAGLEQSYDDALSGHHSGVRSLLDQLLARRPVGDDLYTTLDPKAQEVATRDLAGHQGAVVALDPRTGAVKALVSEPSFNPSTIDSASVRRNLQLNSLFNFATQPDVAPGSTFKTVTATAALDTGQFTLSSQVSGKDGVVISGVPLHNDDNDSFGLLDLVDAYAKSVNTVFAQVAVAVGKPRMRRYMERFGFNRIPQLDFPATEMGPSGEFTPHNHLLSPTSTFVDVGRMGIGQDKLRVSALQMALVASAVANKGVLMRPHIGARLVDSDGRTVRIIGPQVQQRVMSARTAADVTTMMEAVVQRGTGTTANIPGIQVAGKTGTSETVSGSQINNAWFIAFAPATHPRVAVAVSVHSVPGFGAQFAAPIAKDVIESLL